MPSPLTTRSASTMSSRRRAGCPVARVAARRRRGRFRSREVLDAALAAGRHQRVGDRLRAADRDRRRLEARAPAAGRGRGPAGPGGSSGKHPVDVVRRAHEQRAQLGRLEEVVRELAHAHELVDGLDADLPDRRRSSSSASGAPRRRRAEPVRARMPASSSARSVVQPQVRVGVAAREARICS